jgi:hypothetical protein
MNLELSTYVILVMSTAYTLTCYFHSKSGSNSTKEQVEASFLKLRRRQQAFFNQLSLLEENAGKYFQTLNEAGLPEAIKIRNQLLVANDDIKKFIDDNNYASAEKLISYIDNPRKKPFKEITSLTNARLNSLYEWKERANTYITACVIKLGIITSQATANQELEVVRRKTLHSLEQLRDVLNKEKYQSDKLPDW